MVSMKTTENNDDPRRQYQIVVCFRDHGSPHAIVSELFPITRINPRFSTCDKAVR